MQAAATTEAGQIVRYKTPKAVMIWGLFLALTFTISSVRHIFFSHDSFNPATKFYTLKLVVNWLSIIFFGGGALLILSSVIDMRPGLVIDSEGLVMNFNGMGRVLWADVSEISLIKVKFGKAIGVKLKEPEKYITRMNFLRRTLMTWSYKSNNAVPISANVFRVPEDKLLQVLNDKLSAYRKS